MSASRGEWIARAFLPYLLAGILWVTVGAVVLGYPRGAGLVFVGVACLGLGCCGALWRVRRGYGLLRPLPRADSACR